MTAGERLAQIRGEGQGTAKDRLAQIRGSTASAPQQQDERGWLTRAADFALSGPDGGPGMFRDFGEWIGSGPDLPTSAKRVGGGLMSGATLGLAEPWKEEIEGTAGAQAGELVGTLLPFTGAAKAVGSIPKIAKMSGLAKPLTRGALTGGLLGVAEQGVNVTKGGEFDPAHVGKEAGAFAAFDTGLSMLGKAGGVARKLVPNWLKQARNRVKHPESQKVFSEIEKADEIWHRTAGEELTALRDTPLRKKVLRIDKSGQELADMIEAGKLPAVNKVMDRLFFKMKAAGIDVSYTGRTGKKYFPRMVKHDVAEQVRSDLAPILKDLKAGNPSDKALAKALESKKGTAEIIDYMIKNGSAKNYAEAIQRLEKHASEQLFGTPSFLKKRTLKLPAHIYERDARKVIPWYVNAASKRIAQARVWGPDFKKATDRLKRIADDSIEDANRTQKILDMWSGEFEKSHGLRGRTAKMVDAAMGFEFATKIGAGTAVIPNTTQTAISTLAEHGLINTVIGGAKLLTKGGRQAVRRSGVLNQSLNHAVAGYEPGGIMGKFSRVMAKASGFTGINKFNISLAASTMNVAIRRWHKQAQGGSVFSAWARKRLKDFGVDYRKKLTEKTILEKMYRFGTDSQLQRNILKDPVIMNDPRFRPMFMFKRFGYRQATMMKDMLKREIPRGNVMPLLRLMAVGAAGGEFVVWAKNRVKEYASGEPQYRKDEQATFERAINNLVAVGSFGVVSDMVDFEKLSGLGSKFKFAATPVFVSDAEKAIETYTSVMEDWEKYGDGWLALHRNVDKAAQFAGSIPKYASQRLRTKGQRTNRARYFKGRERTAVLDLILDGNKKDATRRIELWNKNHSDNPLTAADISMKQLTRRAKLKARQLAEAKV